VPLSRPAFAWLAVAAWAALIFALSSIPNLGTGLEGWDLVLRKAAHLAEYAVLGALIARALGAASPSQRLNAAPATWAWILGVVYAASDEVHQHFVPGRHGSGLDLLIDAVGVAAGVAAVRLAFASRSLRRASTGDCRRSTGKARAPDDGAAKSAP
jgi:VanZ family protein